MLITDLNSQFIELGQRARELASLLAEAEEKYWVLCIDRALPRVDANELAGATLILGCFGGMDTLSDLTIGKGFEAQDPVRYRNLNARLNHVRTETFEAARRIAARQTW
ncbi:MAG TPA: hypothetical protein DER02_14205 [Gammaproteobacteria bacterium]|nr:hypothetical protein [Gammaproteobacteria bacterium]